ncbi:MAG: 3-dehydroquinate synthase [Limnochordia bacterium]|nr:3-dehydroquinate synthase [Bacillota bacterium]
MDRIVVQAPSGAYNIHFGRDIWQQVQQMARGYDQALVVSDKNVAALYGHRLPFPISPLEPGEGTKSFETIAALVDDWAERGLDRYSLVIALGGGVVGDLVGLTASVYRRGIAYVQIPTTLVAQVDGGVGGKTGINTPRGKNLVGTFYQPWGVFIDPSVLSTLPDREITNGLGEVLKYGVVNDPALFEVVRGHVDAFYELDLEVVAPVIRRCVEIKGEIVAADERDRGLRRILNHGHTFGHAIEKAAGYRHNHGEAVLMGMLLEGRLAHLLGLLSSADLAAIEDALFRVKLDYSFAHLDKGEMISALIHDKKNRKGSISFILPREIGRAEEVLLSVEDVEKYWDEVIRG